MENPQQESETPSGDPLGGLDGRELDREIEREGGATYRTGETTRSHMSYCTTTTIVIISEHNVKKYILNGLKLNNMPSTKLRGSWPAILY